jgi:SAM-dependent methyltransferase
MSNRCRVCNHNDLRFVFRIKENNIFKCLKCNFVQVADLPDRGGSRELYGPSYFTSHKYTDYPTLWKENERRLSFMKEFLETRMARILEVGCATGDFIHYAQSEYEMYGFDLSKFAVTIAREKNPNRADKIWCGELEDQSLEQAFFDGICLWDVIEHIWDPLSACRKLLESLKPNGYLFISTPDIEALVPKIMGRYWAFMTPPEHFGFFGHKSLKYMFEDRLQAQIVKFSNRGKWGNVGFILHKIGRVAPFWVPISLLKALQKSFLAKLVVYVPSGDIQYIVVKKRG